ncbi:MAG: hypothetical protein HN904_11780 [Victivallales bacterium]|jgi:hypothetical protein|nr:hypothetical protein [Victivallales bacterium]
MSGLMRPVHAQDARYSWSPANAPQGAHAPELVSFRGAHALRFARAKATRVDLGQGAGDRLRIDGALTLTAVVQLAQTPQTKTPFISKWHCVKDGRSYELGVQPNRTVFLAISGSGIYDQQAREFRTDEKLRVGVPYVVVGVYQPGKRMSVYINGHPCGSQKSRVPKRVFDSETPVLVGNRPGHEASTGLDGLIAQVRIQPVVVGGKAIAEQSKELGLVAMPETDFEDTRPLPPCRAITKGPKFHWFGYYDKLQFDPSCRYVLGMEVDFNSRSPRPDDVIKVGMVDLQDNDAWIELGSTRAWCWQQGCMLQWRPGSQSEVLWNDRQDGRFVCHILDVNTRKKRTIPHPIYTVSPDGKTGFAPDFRRVQDMRPGYGYCGLPDPNRDVLAPKDSGIARIDLETGESTLIVSLAGVAAIPHEHGDISQMKHYFNHLLVNTDGTRLEFLNRWRGPDRRGFGTRMLTCNADGSDLHVLDPHGRTSHFIWRDPAHILAWSWHPDLGNGFILYQDKTREVEVVGKDVMTQNGHNTYLPNPDWILNDTYPDNRGRQHPYLYHLPTGKRFWLGHFRNDRGHGGEWRCDTHPRFSPDGKSVVIDSAHDGKGRQLYLIDISKIVDSAR